MVLAQGFSCSVSQTLAGARARIISKVPSLTCVAIHTCPVGWDPRWTCWLKHLHVIFSCGLGFLTAWQLVPKQESKAEGHGIFMTNLKVIWLHLWHGLLVKAVTKARLGSREGTQIPPQWEEWQHHVIRRACRMGCIVATIFVRFFFLAALHGLWDLSSLTRDWTRAPCSESMKS